MKFGEKSRYFTARQISISFTPRNRYFASIVFNIYPALHGIDRSNNDEIRHERYGTTARLSLLNASQAV